MMTPDGRLKLNLLAAHRQDREAEDSALPQVFAWMRQGIISVC